MATQTGISAQTYARRRRQLMRMAARRNRGLKRAISSSLVS